MVCETFGVSAPKKLYLAYCSFALISNYRWRCLKSPIVRFFIFSLIGAPMVFITQRHTHSLITTNGSRRVLRKV